MFNIVINRKDIDKALTLANKIRASATSSDHMNTRGVALVIAPLPGGDECEVRLICSDVIHARALGVVVVTDFTMLRAPVETVVLDLHTASFVKAIGKHKLVNLRYEDEALRCDDTHYQIMYSTSEIQRFLAVPTEITAWSSVSASEFRRGITDLIREGNSLNAAQVEMSVEGGVTVRIRSSIAWNVASLGGAVDYPFDGAVARPQSVIGVGPLAALATIIDRGTDESVEVALMGEPARFLRLRYENVTIFASLGRIRA